MHIHLAKVHIKNPYIPAALPFFYNDCTGLFQLIFIYFGYKNTHFVIINQIIRPKASPIPWMMDTVFVSVFKEWFLYNLRERFFSCIQIFSLIRHFYLLVNEKKVVNGKQINTKPNAKNDIPFDNQENFNAGPSLSAYRESSEQGIYFHLFFKHYNDRSFDIPRTTGVSIYLEWRGDQSTKFI